MGWFRRRARDAEPVVDVRADTELDLRSPDATGTTTPEAVWGLPTRCPACGDYGYLDRIDVVHEVMHQHCPRCWHRWETHRTETTSEV